MVTQNIPLQTIRLKEGYHARIITSGHNVPICQPQSLLDSTKNSSDVIKSKYCRLRHDNSGDILSLEGESYNYALRVDLPYTEHNLNLGGIIATVEFMDPNLNIYDAHGYAVFTKRRGLLSWVWYLIEIIFGYEGTMNIEIGIRENFSNKIFQVAVVDIMIESPALIINTVNFSVTTELKGYRYFMYHWFWSCAVFSIFWLSIAIRIAFGIILSILIKFKITTRRAIKAFSEGIKKKLSKGWERLTKPIKKLVDKFDPFGPILDSITNYYLLEIFNTF